MTEAIAQFFSSIFGDNVALATVLIAIIPLIELKGAIPFAMSGSFWAEHALTSWPALGFAFLGSSIVVPILALILKPLINWLDKYKFFHAIIEFFTSGIKTKSKKIESSEKESKKSVFFKMLSVTLFVAFPVPLTGVWTGTAFAVLLGLNFWQTCLSAITGNLICGLIVTFICSIFPQATSIILYVFLGILVVAFATKLILHFVKKKKNKAGAAIKEDNLNNEK